MFKDGTLSFKKVYIAAGYVMRGGYLLMHRKK